MEYKSSEQLMALLGGDASQGQRTRDESEVQRITSIIDKYIDRYKTIDAVKRGNDLKVEFEVCDRVVSILRSLKQSIRG